MKRFLGSYTGGIDKKGRVSIPSAFRALVPEGTSLILLPSHKAACIQGFTEEQFSKLEDSMDRMALFSPEEVAMANALFAKAGYCAPDKEGRCVLREDHIRHAGLREGETVLFVGLRNRFEIWEPSAHEKHYVAQIAQAALLTSGIPQVAS